jgi:hypothetical protein
MRLNITTSNPCTFKEFLRPLSVLPNSATSWHMRVIYTSRGDENVRVRVMYRKYCNSYWQHCRCNGESPVACRHTHNNGLKAK